MQGERGDRESRETRLGRGSRGKASGRVVSQSMICLGRSGLHYACAHIIKHNIKYSLLLPLDTGFIFVEGKPPRRPVSMKVSTQQNTGRLVRKGQGEKQWNAKETMLREVMGVI